MYRILSAHGVMEWVDFLTWMLFVLSAVVAIYERGSAHHQCRALCYLWPREEIQDFCRDVKHSNYIF